MAPASKGAGEVFQTELPLGRLGFDIPAFDRAGDLAWFFILIKANGGESTVRRYRNE
jgi:hypothetical protein